MFDLDMERNIPTLFSSLLLAISSFLFFVLSYQKDNYLRYWRGLSLVFLFLSFDESAKIHEKIGDFTSQFIVAEGYMYYPWVLSYSVAILLLASIYLKFFLQFERKVFWSFILSAILFLTGAIGFDILGAYEASMHGTQSIWYSIYYTIEESLEMFGVIYLIHILLKLLKNSHIHIH
jgi:hypothetical protein